MALDINETQKDNNRIALSRNKIAGSKLAGGIYDPAVCTSQLADDSWLTTGFYFPVDSVVYSAGMQVTAVVNTNNDRSDTALVLVSRTKQPTNSEGIVQVGMQFFSPRDKLYGSIDAADDKGTTPYLPGQDAKVDNKGDAIDWSINDGASTEVSLHGTPGWLNKAERMQIMFGTQVAPSTRTHNVDFTKVKSRGRKRSQKGFKVEAGTTLVYFVRNITGCGNEDRELNLTAHIVPRVLFFPMKDIVQNLEYNNRSEARWGANHKVELATASGHGVNRLWIAARATDGHKP